MCIRFLGHRVLDTVPRLVSDQGQESSGHCPLWHLSSSGSDRGVVPGPSRLSLLPRVGSASPSRDLLHCGVGLGFLLQQHFRLSCPPQEGCPRRPGRPTPGPVPRCGRYKLFQVSAHDTTTRPPGPSSQVRRLTRTPSDDPFRGSRHYSLCLNYNFCHPGSYLFAFLCRRRRCLRRRPVVGVA